MRNVSKNRGKACGFLEASKQKGHLEFMGVLKKDGHGSYVPPQDGPSRMGGFTNHYCFPGAKGSDKVQHCHTASLIKCLLILATVLGESNRFSNILY